MKDYQITIVTTDHPKILKLEANHFLVKGSYEYKNIDEAKNSPLAKQLFYLPFIKTVYISGNFVALERFEIVEWHEVQEALVEQLTGYLNAGDPVVFEEVPAKKEAITVYGEVTPNPAVMKFVVNKRIVPVSCEFKDPIEAKPSPLARELFLFPFVKAVFFDENYIAISKYETVDWEEITSPLRAFIRDFLAEGNAVLSEAFVSKAKSSPELHQDQTSYDEISREIIAILEEYVKPAVASDGGNICFQSYEADTKTVNVILQGACSGCPSSLFTLKNGIETLLKDKLGDKIREVVALNS